MTAIDFRLIKSEDRLPLNHWGNPMLKQLSGALAATLLLSACGATPNVETAEVVDHKAAIAKCMKENKDNQESCVSTESVARTGLVCRNEMVTGTRLPRRVCTTAKQRSESAKAARGVAEHMQRRGFPSNNG